MLSSYQKRVITAICQSTEPEFAARIFDSHRKHGRLVGVERQEIIDYAYQKHVYADRYRSILNSEMEEG